LMMFLWSFGLALLFLLAGAGTRFALRKRSWQTFLSERTARLLVPFLAGTLLLSPIQGFIEATHKGTFSGLFPDYLGRWAAGLLDRPILSPTLFGIGYHLWFLGFLFAISVIALPLCEGLTRPRGRRAVDALARTVRWPGSTLGFAVPIVLLMAVGAALGTNEHDWFEFLWYLGYFVTGFVLFSDERFTIAVRRDGWLALAVAVSSTFLLVATPVGGLLASMADKGLDLPHLAVGILFGLEGWAWTLVILNVGMRAARLQRPVGDHLGESVLPIYVIHQPVILAVAFFVVRSPVGILPKWIAVFGVSLVVTLAFVELGLRAPYARVLLGARARPPASQVSATDRVGASERPSLPTASARHG
jgi:glucan biosynthesis protein C